MVIVWKRKDRIKNDEGREEEYRRNICVRYGKGEKMGREGWE